jgi:hypothetical protein
VSEVKWVTDHFKSISVEAVLRKSLRASVLESQEPCSRWSRQQIPRSPIEFERIYARRLRELQSCSQIELVQFIELDQEAVCRFLVFNEILELLMKTMRDDRSSMVSNKRPYGCHSPIVKTFKWLTRDNFFNRYWSECKQFGEWLNDCRLISLFVEMSSKFKIEKWLQLRPLINCPAYVSLFVRQMRFSKWDRLFTKGSVAVFDFVA